jgi:uncharacterized protein (TIGR02001 family)
MKKTAVLLAALATGALLQAQDPTTDAASSYSVTVDFPYVSSYVFRGVKFADDSLQPSVKVTVGGAYAGIWYSQPLDSDFDNEVDFYAGYGFEVAPGWTVDLGVTAYHYPELDTSGGADDTTYEFYAGLAGTIGGGVTGNAYIYRDVTLKITTIQGSLFYGIPISDKVSCNITGTLGFASMDDADEYTYYGLSAVFPYKISDKATVTVGGNYGNNDIAPAEHDLFWVNAGFSYTF